MAEAAASKAQQDLAATKAKLEATMASQLRAARGSGKTQQNLEKTQSQLQMTAAQAEEQKKKLAEPRGEAEEGRARHHREDRRREGRRPRHGRSELRLRLWRAGLRGRGLAGRTSFLQSRGRQYRFGAYQQRL